MEKKNQKEPDVVIITDWFGALHIVPAANADFYADQNEKNKATIYQYKIGKTMSEKDAIKQVEKSEGRDPDFTKPTDLNVMRNENKSLQDENETLRKQLEELKGSKGKKSAGEELI
jgi:hypothetical protein